MDKDSGERFSASNCQPPPYTNLERTRGDVLTIETPVRLHGASVTSSNLTAIGMAMSCGALRCQPVPAAILPPFCVSPGTDTNLDASHRSHAVPAQTAVAGR